MRKLMLFIFIFTYFFSNAQELSSPYYNTINFYNNKIKPSEEIVLRDSIYGYEWKFQSWKHEGKDYYLYNENAKITEFKTTSLYENNEWYTDWKLTYIYNDDELLVEFINQRRNPNTSEFENYTYYFNTYNMQGLLTMDSVLLWDSESSSWKTKWKEVHTYNNDNLLENRLSWVWNPEFDVWDTNSQYIYSYFDDGKMKDYISQQWMDLSSTWKNSNRFSYTYNEDGQLSIYKWDDWDNESEEWSNLIIFTYSYDSSGYLIENIRKNWDNISEEWYPFYRYIYSNNNEGLVDERLTQYWDYQDSTWLNNYNEFYYYSTHQITQVITNEINNDIILYPNPVSNVLNMLNNSSTDYEIKIYDMFGHICKSEMFRSEFKQLDLSNFKKGIYFISFYNNGNKQFTKRIILK